MGIFLNKQNIDHTGNSKFWGNAIISISRTELHGKKVVPVIYALHITPFFAVGVVALHRSKEL